MDYKEKFDQECARIERMLRRFLVPMLLPEMRVLSIGCGMGSDVLSLRKLEFQASGLDPSRLSLEDLPAEDRAHFRIGAIEDLPFGDERFDFAYALDVIEHVGCAQFGTVVTPETDATRIRFIAACLKVLSPGGVLLLTTSNRLCPVDPGHWHKYHWFGRRFGGRKKFGLSVPWSEKNFLVSLGDVKRLVALAGEGQAFNISCVRTALYPGISERKNAASRLMTAILHLADMPLLIGSFLAPILIVKIERCAEPA